MAEVDLETTYRAYLDALNERRFADLVDHVHDDLVYNDRPITRADYVRMLDADVAALPDLQFRIDLLVVQDDLVAARLWFDCTAVRDHFGLPTAGHQLQFAEHVFYRFDVGRIRSVRSLIDTTAIRDQVQGI